MMRLHPLARLCVAVALGVGLSPGTLTVAAEPSASARTSAPSIRSIQVQQAWIRWLPANLPAGGYVTLSNAGDAPVTLVGASSPDYADVDLHRSLTRNGTASMVAVTQIRLAAHATLSFAALGYHLMLTQPRRSVTPGDHVPITLHFADGGSLTASFEVRKPDATAADKRMAGMPGMAKMPGTTH